MIIDIAHLTYTYPGADEPALRDLSLQVEEGEFLLVAGVSGAGKSTLLRRSMGLCRTFTGANYWGAIGAGRDPFR